MGLFFFFRDNDMYQHCTPRRVHKGEAEDYRQLPLSLS